MKNVLIVDGDVSFLQTVKAELSQYKDRFKLHLAENGLMAVEILKTEPIDYMVTGLNMSKMDGFELLIFRNQNFPLLLTSVMTKQDLSAVKDSLQKMGAFKVMAKPLTSSDLLDNINLGLTQTSQHGSLEGISLANFLQLIEMEQKTYLLEVRSRTGKVGLFFFQQGVPVDALCGNLRGEAAALEIITWDNVRISFRNVPPHKVKRRIKKSLMSLLMRGASLADDKNEAERSAVAGNLAPGDVENTQIDADDGSTLTWNGVVDRTVSVDLPEYRTAPKIMQELMNVSGVRAALLAARDAEIFASAGVWSGADAKIVGEAVALVYRGADRMSHEMALNSFNMLTFEASQGSIICNPVGDSLLVVFAIDSKTLGIIRQKVKKLAGELGRSV